MTKTLASYETLLELRIWLKIGLAQEKKGSYDAAILAYQEAIQIAERFFAQALREAASDENTVIPFHIENLNHSKLLFQPYLCQAYLLEKSATNVHTSFELIETFLAKLRNLLGFDKLVNQANFPLFGAECLMKAADLFYYKGYTPYHSQREQADDRELQFIERAESLYFEAIQWLLQIYFTGTQAEFKDKPYAKLLEILTKIFCSADIRPAESAKTAPSVQVFQMLANAVSDLSNVLLTKIRKDQKKVQISNLESFLLSWRSMPYDNLTAFEKMRLHFKVPGPWNALAMNLLASRIFLWASMHKEAAFEYEKMIQTLRYCNIDFERANYADIITILEVLKKEIYDPGIQHYNRTYLNARTFANDPVFSRSPNLAKEPPEVENLTLYWLRLQDRFIKKSRHKKIRQEIDIMNHVESISAEDVFDNVKIRIDRLNFKVNKLNDWFQEQFGIEEAAQNEPEKRKPKNKTKILAQKICNWIGKDQEKEERLFLCIKDGLFCCYNSITLREIHSNTYWWLHLGRAFMHYFLAQWLQRWEAYCIVIENKDIETEKKQKQEQEKELMNYLGAHNMQINQQMQMALENFHQVKETHTNGRAYKTLIKRMYFLNNDFNDRAYHFHLAHERAQLRRGKVEKKIKEVEAQIKGDWTKKSMEKYEPPSKGSQLGLPFA